MDASAYLSQLLGLLPPGDALPREPGSRLERLLAVPAGELARVDGRVEALLREADPARTTEMLVDWERALGLPDECYPNEKFSRASTAWYFDGAGVLREAAVDEPRYLYDAAGQRTEALLLEDAGTNFVVNPSFEGFIAGTPGVTPASIYLRPADANLGLSRQIIGAGVEDQIPYLDVRYFGTMINGGIVGGTPMAVFNFSGFTAASIGEVWTFSVFCRLIGGSKNGIGFLRLDVAERVGSSYVSGAQTVLSFLPPLGAAPLRDQRFQVSRTLTSGTTNNLWARMNVRLENGAAVDFTLRIGLPQLERAAAPTTPMLPPAGTQAASSRAADISYIATVEERRARVLARLIERFEPTPIAIIGLAARLGDTVTLTEFRPHDCEDDADQPLLDDAWAHAFQVAGASSLVVEFTCLDGCETPLSQWRTGAYECAIRRFAPAHTVPIFSYA